MEAHHRQCCLVMPLSGRTGDFALVPIGVVEGGGGAPTTEWPQEAECCSGPWKIVAVAVFGDDDDDGQNDGDGHGLWPS
jgi:hypothetical protein